MRFLWIGSACLFAFTLSLPLRAEAPPAPSTDPGPWTAVSYKEWPEGGRFQKSGRNLGTGREKLFTVDVNSRVDIDFDRASLADQLKNVTTPADAALTDRLADLTTAAGALGEAYKTILAAAERYSDLVKEEKDKEKQKVDSDAFHAKIVEATQWQNQVFSYLHRAIQQRLESAGKDPQEARKEADKEFDPIYKGGPTLYDWVGLRNLLAREISLANEDLDARKAMIVELKAQLIGAAKKADLRLPGWNKIDAQPNQPLQKVTVLPPGTMSQKEDLTQKVDAANNSGTQLKNDPNATEAAKTNPTIANAKEAAEMPLPVPVIRHSVDDPLPNTFFDLAAAGGAKPGDRAEVVVNIYRGVKPDGTPMDETPLFTWLDTFEVGSFGVQDAIVSSLAFANQEHTKDWKPAATASWILSYQRWPQTEGPGGRPRINRLRPFSGIGISASALDFDPNTDVEVGFAPTLSFLNDFLLVGYGWNLQVKEKRNYWFFSVRILEGQGILERLAPKKQTGDQ